MFSSLLKLFSKLSWESHMPGDRCRSSPHPASRQLPLSGLGLTLPFSFTNVTKVRALTRTADASVLPLEHCRSPGKGRSPDPHLSRTSPENTTLSGSNQPQKTMLCDSVRGKHPERLSRGTERRLVAAWGRSQGTERHGRHSSKYQVTS